MKNVNYNLVKLLHCTQDIIWRIEKHYMNDAQEAKCHSAGTLEKILEDERKHSEMLVKEIKMRMDAGVFN